MNRARKSDWEQDGIYITYNPDLSDSSGWSKPERIIKVSEFYPQIIGIGAGETDKQAGEKARLFVHGKSVWEIYFLSQSKKK